MKIPSTLEIKKSKIEGSVGYQCSVIPVNKKVVDRLRTQSYIISNLALAERFKKSVDEQAWFNEAEIETDMNGKTYLNYSSFTMVKYLNSDLKKLGY